MIANKYSIIEKINEGSFGTVFKAENIRTHEKVAVKIERKFNEITTLKHEAKIYQYLGKNNGFSTMKMFGTTDSINYLVLDILGDSLNKYINHYQAVPLKHVMLIGIQIIKRVQFLHEKLLLHRDIKPSNFVFGVGNKKNTLYLIDFGLSKRYDYDGKHIDCGVIKNIIGSVNFVSLNVHNLIEPSRKDDIESSIYVILNMLLGKLEWFDKSSMKNIISLKTNLIHLPEIPDFIKNMLLYTRNLHFNETPDYDFLIQLIINEYNKKYNYV